MRAMLVYFCLILAVSSLKVQLSKKKWSSHSQKSTSYYRNQIMTGLKTPVYDPYVSNGYDPNNTSDYRNYWWSKAADGYPDWRTPFVQNFSNEIIYLEEEYCRNEGGCIAGDVGDDDDDGSEPAKCADDSTPCYMTVRFEKGAPTYVHIKPVKINCVSIFEKHHCHTVDQRQDGTTCSKYREEWADLPESNQSATQIQMEKQVADCVACEAYHALKSHCLMNQNTEGFDEYFCSDEPCDGVLDSYNYPTYAGNQKAPQYHYVSAPLKPHCADGGATGCDKNEDITFGYYHGSGADFQWPHGPHASETGL